jgi:hypothetical protein
VRKYGQLWEAFAQAKSPGRIARLHQSGSSRIRPPPDHQLSEQPPRTHRGWALSFGEHSPRQIPSILPRHHSRRCYPAAWRANPRRPHIRPPKTRFARLWSINYQPSAINGAQHSNLSAPAAGTKPAPTISYQRSTINGAQLQHPFLSTIISKSSQSGSPATGGDPAIAGLSNFFFEPPFEMETART